MQDDRPDRYYIPDNLDDKRHFFHIPDRNLIETVVAEVVVYNIVKLIPAETFIKIIAGVLVMLVIGIIGIIGIKNESVVEFVATTMQFKKKKRVLHYRRCDQRTYDREEEANTRGSRDSKAGDFIKKIEDAALKRIERRLNEGREKGE